MISNRDDNVTDSKEYVLKSHGDFLALYYDDKIMEVYEDIVISALPPIDREKFLSGIIVEDITKLEDFLEDFE